MTGSSNEVGSTMGEPGRGILRRPLSWVVGGGLVAWAVLATAVHAAMLLPGEQYLSGLPGAARFDYSALTQRLSPLDPEFVADILGLTPPQGGGVQVPALGGSEDPQEIAVDAGPPPAVSARSSGVVDHAAAAS